MPLSKVIIYNLYTKSLRLLISVDASPRQALNGTGPDAITMKQTRHYCVYLQSAASGAYSVSISNFTPFSYFDSHCSLQLAEPSQSNYLEYVKPNLSNDHSQFAFKARVSWDAKEAITSVSFLSSEFSFYSAYQS